MMSRLRHKRRDDSLKIHNKNSRLQMFFKIGVLQDLARFTGKHLCWSLFLRKFQARRPATLLKETRTQVFSGKI